jgi:hypothetical protein
MHKHIRVLLEKDDMFGVMGFYPLGYQYVMSSWDSRMDKPAIHATADPVAAKKAFDEAVALSRDRGWTILYYGKPNYG